MNRQEFINILRSKLHGRIDDIVLEDHIQYYENYIFQEMKKGYSEQDVLQELGDPSLIAKTILQTSGKDYFHKQNVVDEEGNTESEGLFQNKNWKKYLIIGIVILSVCFFVVFIVRAIFALLPLILVAGGMLWIAKKIRS